ncbi:MAG: thioredoxin domain-containing protein [Thermovirgaceae bacterium]
MTPERLDRNNLDSARSPYLLQHAGNPVWWQEWGKGIIEEASRRDVPIFVSSGYATCHWCHVMAAGAFSDDNVAEYLNSHFVCVKVDREERPDIDHYLMDFLTATTGSGGWPLNAFLTPRLEPIFAFTYLPAQTEGGMPGLLDVAKGLNRVWREEQLDAAVFMPSAALPDPVSREQVLPALKRLFDHRSGGFGRGAKFPPHCSLLYLLHLLEKEESPAAGAMCRKTLDAMRLGGLNDHLQGGLFRYCVDERWHIPHFEKMLYDQAMGLWCYSLAASVLKEEAYASTAETVARCLGECFEREGLFLAAFDADTQHEEGGTYLWGYDELESLLSREDFRELKRVYHIEPGGNFEGRIHLVKRVDENLPEIEAKLLETRRERPQPEADTKILCGNNALAVMALSEAGYLLQKKTFSQMADSMGKRLLDVFWDGRRLAHCVSRGALQEQSFLFDAAALLAAVLTLAKENPQLRSVSVDLASYVESFRGPEGWVESRPDDFHHVPASVFDHPVPSGAAMAEYALVRAALLEGKDPGTPVYRQPLSADFFNVTALVNEAGSPD